MHEYIKFSVNEDKTINTIRNLRYRQINFSVAQSKF